MKLKVKFEENIIKPRLREFFVWIYNRKLIDKFCIFFKYKESLNKLFKTIKIGNSIFSLMKSYDNIETKNFHFQYLSFKQELIERIEIILIKSSNQNLLIKFEQIISFEHEWNLKEEKISRLLKTITPLKPFSKKFISNFLSIKSNENICDTCILRFNYEMNDYCNETYIKQL